MSQDHPSIGELLRTVREFIDDITPKLDGQDRYHALCASYLVAIVERELVDGGGLDRDEAAALQAFNGAQSALPAAYAELASDIRNGQYDQRWDELMALLMQHVVNKVSVSKPDYLHAMHRAASPRPEAT